MLYRSKIIFDEDNHLLLKVDDFISSHPKGNYFQSKFLFDFYNTVKNHNPFYIMILGDNQIVGILLGVIIIELGAIKKHFSRRCIIEGGPLTTDDTKIIPLILKQIDKYIASKVIYTEFRNLFDQKNYKNIYNDFLWNYKPHLNYLVRTDSLEEVKKRFSRSKKGQLNKSLKNGASIVKPNDERDIFEFYLILNKLYRDKIKKPLPDYNFFRDLYLNHYSCKYFLVKYQQKIVGGILAPVYKNTIFEWYICGLDGEYKNIYPSVLATWAPIQYALNNKLKYFDFFGAGEPDRDYGVREFKSKFGGELVEYGRFEKIHKPVYYIIGKVGLKILGWKK